MNYEAWTDKDVEYRVLEAAETATVLPKDGPSGYGRAWPEYIGLYAADLRVRRRASPGAISRMEETWSWLNTMLADSERRLIYAWAAVKTETGGRVSDFAVKEGVNSRTLRRSVTAIFKKIAGNLNRLYFSRLKIEFDGASENLVREQPDKRDAPRRSPRNMMTDDAKPSLPWTPEAAKEAAREIERSNKRLRKRRQRARRKR